LGTGGPLKLAQELLKNPKDMIFVFNSDVICEYPLKEMINQHVASGAEGTIMLTKVEDPSKYGVVVTGENNKI